MKNYRWKIAFFALMGLLAVAATFQNAFTTHPWSGTVQESSGGLSTPFDITITDANGISTITSTNSILPFPVTSGLHDTLGMTNDGPFFQGFSPMTVNGPIYSPFNNPIGAGYVYVTNNAYASGYNWLGGNFVLSDGGGIFTLGTTNGSTVIDSTRTFASPTFHLEMNQDNANGTPNTSGNLIDANPAQANQNITYQMPFIDPVSGSLLFNDIIQAVTNVVNFCTIPNNNALFTPVTLSNNTTVIQQALVVGDSIGGQGASGQVLGNSSGAPIWGPVPPIAALANDAFGTNLTVTGTLQVSNVFWGPNKWLMNTNNSGDLVITNLAGGAGFRFSILGRFYFNTQTGVEKIVPITQAGSTNVNLTAAALTIQFSKPFLNTNYTCLVVEPTTGVAIGAITKTTTSATTAAITINGNAQWTATEMTQFP